jgi:hypothetical protein
MRLSGTGVIALAGLALGGFLLWRGTGAAAAAVQSVSAAVDAAWQKARELDQLGTTPGPEGNYLGMPEPEAVTSEPELARWIIDNFGYWEASKWVTATALIRAMAMDPGTGRAPAASTEAGRYLLPRNPNYDETDRLLKRYPGA